MKIFALMLLGISLLVGTTGCVALVAGAAAGGGTIAYVNGQLKAPESAPIRKVWKATELAVKELGLVVVQNRHDELSGKLVARNSQDQKIDIEVVSLGTSQSEVRIRVGMFGDQNLSRLILLKIESNL